MSVNGKYFSWEDITIFLPQGALLDVQDIEYSDEKEVEEVYGKGSKPVGYGRGNYKGAGKLTLKREGYDQLMAYCKTQGKAFYGLDPFPITVSYANSNDAPVTDKLKDCKFTKRDFKGAQGDKSVNVELPFIIIGGINSDGVDATADNTSLH